MSRKRCRRMKLKSLLSDGIFPNIQNVITGATDFIRGNPIVSTASVGLGAGLVGGLVGRATKRRSTKSKKNKRTNSKSRRKRTKRKTTKKGRRIRYTPRTAGKGRDRSTRRIRHTKNGQPYIILKSGKARFIKKSSARRSRKIKGGRY
jgi:hypothetical protein